MTEERTRRMLLWVAVFILLSARAIAEETRCYWCGPLAEQVHRSQRAPPCDPFEQHQTVCDSGYTHCAIVATSPPYAESRLCVKFYQDECYSLYCNSTKTWRMVCPCRGDLCNGANTERENNAFSTLAKIVKTKRNKRDLFPKQKSTFLNMISRTRDNTTNTNNTKVTNAIDAQSEPQPIEITFKNTTALNNVSKRYNDETVIEHGSTDSLKTEENTISSITTTMPTSVDVIKDQNEATTPIDVKIIQQSSEMTTTMKPTTIQQLAVVNKDNVKENMPPAEALQHNETPKVTEHTTIGTVEISTMENIVPTKETNQTKNSATHNILHLFTPIFGIILYL